MNTNLFLFLKLNLSALLINPPHSHPLLILISNLLILISNLLFLNCILLLLLFLLVLIDNLLLNPILSNLILRSRLFFFAKLYDAGPFIIPSRGHDFVNLVSGPITSIFRWFIWHNMQEKKTFKMFFCFTLCKLLLLTEDICRKTILKRECCNDRFWSF